MVKTHAPLFDFLDDEIKSSALFRQALVHRSANIQANYEVLEFLGDSALSLVISEALIAKLNDASEGELSRLRASLVRGSTLASIGEENGLGPQLVLGSGEMKSGGERRDSILEDAVEAIFGAVFRLKGFEYTRDYILAVFATRLSNLPHPDSLKDPKTRLQEWLQSRSRPLPVYEPISEIGKDHEKIFVTSCTIDFLLSKDVSVTLGESTSRRKAEQLAAEKMLEVIQQTETGK